MPHGPSLAEVLAEQWCTSAEDAYLPLGEPGSLQTLGDVVLVGRASDEHLGSISRGLTRRSISFTHIACDEPSAIPDQRIDGRGATAESCRAIVLREASAGAPLAHHNEQAARYSWGHLAPTSRPFAARETAAAVSGFLGTLTADIWINEPWSALEADDKLRQLRAATKCGFSVPNTLVTSSADAAREMLREHPEGLVHKCLDSPFVWEGQDAAGYLYTTEVGTEHLDHISPFSQPVLLQERLTINAELRVTVVGDECFAARIRQPDRQIDWRRRLGAGSVLRYESCRLESEVRLKLIELMRLLGLEFAAIDLAETPRGIVFLEVNPSGSFLWLERGLGLPITDAICDLIAAS